MGSKQKAPIPEVPRSDTLQRMLDMEQKGKISRMQTAGTAPPIVRSSSYTIPIPSSQPNRGPMIKHTSRSMSTPSLSLNIPTPKVRYVLKDGDVVPEEEAEAGAESETSSICHSPGWDDMMGTKRKKQRKEAKMRKKEKEKAEAKALAKAKTEAKHAEKLRNRLSKATVPPTARRLSKVGGPMDRSSSAPAALKPLGLFNGSPEEIIINEESARRGSIEVGLQSFIQATQAIPVSWRSSHGTPATETPTRISPSQDQPPLIPAFRSDSFMGGLKLKLAEEASAQQQPWRQSQDGYKKDPKEGNKFELGLDELDNHTRPKRAVTGAEEQFDDDGVTVRTPQQWESIYEQAARIMRLPELSQTGSDDTAQDKIIKKSRDRTYPPTSYFPVEVDSYRSQRNSSAGSNPRTDSRPTTSEDKDRSGSRVPTEHTSSRPLSKTRAVADERGSSTERGRRNFRSYVERLRKQSGGKSVSSLEDDDYRVDVAAGGNPDFTPRGRRSSWTSIKSLGRNSSTEAPSTIRLARPSNDNTNPERHNYHAAVLDGYTPSSPQSDECEQPEDRTSHRPTQSKGSLSGLKGLKTAARAAFIRNPSAVTSLVDFVSSPTELSTKEQSRPKKRPSSVMVGIDGKPISKAERFFGQPVSAPSYEDATEFQPGSSGQIPSFTYQATSRATEEHESPGQRPWSARVRGRNDVQHTFHSRSTTGSSEEYSTFDESSNVTTPMASTHKDYFPVACDNVNSLHQTSQVPREQGSGAMMSEAMPMKATSSQMLSSSARVSHDPSPISSIPNPDQPSAEIPARLNRHPSLARSVSTPELQQDLSFLPNLRHQPLTKHIKFKDTKSGKGQTSLLSQAQEPGSGTPTSIIKPAPLRPPTKKSESTLPASPISSQYLQNARMSLPRPLRFGAPPPAPGGSDPIAKMFVVCCSCKYFHDMPSKLYECMARSENVVEDKDLGVRGMVSTSVRCPWCNHGMTTACCAGYAAVVVLREKLH